MSAPAASGWRGPLRAAVAIVVVGFLVVWLVKPIGDPCPELDRLPQGSTAGSSPSFSPPGARTCTYMVAGGTQATARYVPWLDWIVLLLAAALAAGALRLASAGRASRGPRAARAPRSGRAATPLRAQRAPRAERPSPTGRAPQPSADRDAADRERARRERADRDRSRRGR